MIPKTRGTREIGSWRALSRLTFSGQRLHRVADSDRAAFDDSRPKAGVEQAFQDHLSSDKPGEVVAGFAALLAFALDLADRKTTSNEVSKVDTTNEDLPSRVGRTEVGLVFPLQARERFGLDQRDVARVRIVEVAVSFKTPARMRNRDRHLARHLTVRGRQVDRLDSSFAHFVGAHCALLSRPSISSRISAEVAKFSLA